VITKQFCFTVPGRTAGKFPNTDSLPKMILNGSSYRHEKRMKKAGLLAEVKKNRLDPSGAVSKAARLKQVYCVDKKKFFSEATEDEMNSHIVFDDGDSDNSDKHRIVQCRLR
jgi:hypothetical protein